MGRVVAKIGKPFQSALKLPANLPVLFAGFPPVVVPAEARTEYITSLWDYQQKGI